MNIFGNCLCPMCNLETRFLMETENDEGFYLLGDALPSKVEEPLQQVIECDYCQSELNVYVMAVEGVISSFLNEREYDAYLKGEKLIVQAPPKAGLEFEFQQELKQFHESFYVPFEQQPFDPSVPLNVNGKQWNIEAIYKKESIETNLTKRMLSPSHDEYWYEVRDAEGIHKWCVVTDNDTHQELRASPKESASELDKVELFSDEENWVTVSVLNEDDEEKEISNAILIVEPPFLKENEVKVDVTDSRFKTQKMFEKKLSENLYIKGFQYVSGVRMLVYNIEGELELDVFAENAEEAMDMVQEELSYSVDEQ